MLYSVFTCADKNRAVSIRVLYMYVCGFLILSFVLLYVCTDGFVGIYGKNLLVVKSEKTCRSLFANYLVF